jgi:16S rRNA (cytosine1402-N4)-methyltransferase
MGTGREHVPVLVQEVVHYIHSREGGIYVDATIGSGGHAVALLETYPDIGMLIGIDRDADAVACARKNLAAFHNRAVVFQGNFKQIKTILSNNNIDTVDGIMFDLGVSSMQLENPSRGFSFMSDGPLDMRMDQTTSLQAKDLINSLSERDMEQLLRTCGEERWAKRIARQILKRREHQPIETTRDLSDLVLGAIPARYYPRTIHPATKTFQAFRITVNDELKSLESGLDAAIDLLTTGGRLCAISFHSLEDRIVKHTFQLWEKSCTCPPRTPVCICGTVQKARVITRKPVAPNDEELQANPRARSAKLRVAERV